MNLKNYTCIQEMRPSMPSFQQQELSMRPAQLCLTALSSILAVTTVPALAGPVMDDIKANDSHESAWSARPTPGFSVPDSTRRVFRAQRRHFMPQLGCGRQSGRRRQVADIRGVGFSELRWKTISFAGEGASWVSRSSSPAQGTRRCAMKLAWHSLSPPSLTGHGALHWFPIPSGGVQLRPNSHGAAASAREDGSTHCCLNRSD